MIVSSELSNVVKRISCLARADCGLQVIMNCTMHIAVLMLILECLFWGWCSYQGRGTLSKSIMVAIAIERFRWHYPILEGGVKKGGAVDRLGLRFESLG